MAASQPLAQSKLTDGQKFHTISLEFAAVREFLEIILIHQPYAWCVFGLCYAAVWLIPSAVNARPLIISGLRSPVPVTMRIDRAISSVSGCDGQRGVGRSRLPHMLLSSLQFRPGRNGQPQSIDKSPWRSPWDRWRFSPQCSM